IACTAPHRHLQYWNIRRYGDDGDSRRALISGNRYGGSGVEHSQYRERVAMDDFAALAVRYRDFDALSDKACRPDDRAGVRIDSHAHRPLRECEIQCAASRI